MKNSISLVAFFALPLAVAACSPTPTNPSATSDNLAGASCTGGSSSIPDDGHYSLTTFGGADDTQGLGCGGSTRDNTWYVASAQRFGCRARLQITTGDRCVVAEVLDCGPAAWVEHNAGNPIIDASPAIAQHLFGVSSAGWSEHASRQIVAELVDSSTPLGPCTVTQTPAPTSQPDMSQPDPTTTDPTTTDPGTMDPTTSMPPPSDTPCDYYGQSMANGTCFYANDGYNYFCNNGAWEQDTYQTLCY